MDSDGNNQNLDLKKDKKANQDPEGAKKAEERESRSTADSNASDSDSVENKSKGKNPVKIPIKIIVPAVIIIVAVIVIAIFLIHPLGKTSVSSVGYTPITYLSSPSLNSIIGGNWSLVYNQTANSTVVKAYAGTGQFPAGTVAAAVQEFIPSSEIAQISTNKSKNNITTLISTAYYINSSSEASTIFTSAETGIASEYANDSRLKFNTSTIGSSSMIYINGQLNSTNSSLENVTELYLLNGKSLVVVSSLNKEIGYKQAKSIVSYMFS
ncbi:MAG: hypothetical protein OH338_01295 [Candidatus Parvarchaeota archaeon]|nr:hypothetical protein [Candidatus Parvarchaeum tengchongense]MCW1298742.1 hypothetical protein [Candidatus Parvarchaeum tengchongense]MCW1312050.1 hypothetical protein [Candidatus Parvarchaeum tengchongense]